MAILRPCKLPSDGTQNWQSSRGRANNGPGCGATRWLIKAAKDDVTFGQNALQHTLRQPTPLPAMDNAWFWSNHATLHHSPQGLDMRDQSQVCIGVKATPETPSIPRCRTKVTCKAQAKFDSTRGRGQASHHNTPRFRSSPSQLTSHPPQAVLQNIKKR